MRDPSAHTCLMNALAVSEFLATFGVLCEASRLSLRDLQQAASSLAHGSTLAQLYASLLRCVLLEKVGSLKVFRAIDLQGLYHTPPIGKALCSPWCMAVETCTMDQQNLDFLHYHWSS